MERYIFSDPDRVPPGLHVIGVPTRNGFVWLEITAAEYEMAVANSEVAHQLATHIRDISNSRVPRADNHIL